VVQGEDYDFGMSSSFYVSMGGYEGYLMSIGMKATTLINILQRLTSYNVELVFDDPNKAVLIRPADKAEDDNETITCLQMPMLLNDK
jgi:DNA polymerase-3 subunit beta